MFADRHSAFYLKLVSFKRSFKTRTAGKVQEGSKVGSVI